jgi:uncharacterized protein (TIGR02596 family)
MMVVITVIGFLLALSAPNLFSLLRANELSTQGEVLRNWLSLAQQQALSTGADVEVRFFRFADLANAQTEPRWRACQFYQYDSQGVLRPGSEVMRLNDPVTISGVASLSPLVDAGRPGLTRGQADAPQLFGKDVSAATADFCSFRFRPDGSTDLPKNVQWYVTLVQDEFDNPTPTNFFCLQIDPYNGSLREYRP